jgi:hypothetical protein
MWASLVARQILVPRCLKHVWRYRSHSVPYEGFQVLKVADLNVVDNALHITPQEKVQYGTQEAKRLVQLCQSISQTSFCPGGS